MADNSSKTSRFDLIFGAENRLSGPFAAMQRSVERLSEGFNRMGASVGRFSAASGLGRLAAGLSGVTQGFRSAYSEGTAAFQSMAGMAGKLSMVMGAAGGGALALAHSTALAGDEAAKAAARAGVSIAVWQEYLHAADLSDVDSEQLAKGFVRLQGIALDAAKGDKTQMSLLKLAGINPKNAKGEVKSAEGLMLELSDKVKALMDAGQQGKATNLIADMFGERGTKLMPLLVGGSAALKEMRGEAYKLGLVFSENDAHASEEFNDNLTRAGKSIKGFGYGIGKLLLPFMSKIVEKFTAWAVSMREGMGTGFAEWAQQLTANVDNIWASIESGLGTMGRWVKNIQTVVEWLGGWGNVLTGLAVIIASKFIVSLGMLALAFGKLGLAILTTPVGWFLAAIAAIAGAVYLIYQNWGAIAGWFSAQWASVRDAFNQNWMLGIVTVLNKFNPVVLVAKAINAMVSYFTGIDLFSIGQAWINSLWAGMSQKWQDLKGWASGLANSVKGFFGGSSGSAPAAGMSGPSAPAVNLGPTVSSLQQSKTEHVERQQLDIRVSSPNGTPLGATMTGGNPKNVSLTGQQMGGAGTW